ncbi:uncharacterized protein K452DRAFT_100066 [Aplosporella prunicola CBS 121167]|uniref:Uncharacterized protein n=1 Tax=Aplosporella prunicola CBS 121167 TaxID=1176127 RepID=A0A6A6B0C6_9PEZI|nr:uncharacterized protein K452DRAFT_100066 [Aplosporella prunicola CBS 121167]KAF2137632.1 hypothetical protein K452DRAFT_100066 [Aplosporella prunicola CBS 121167]
MALCFTAIVFYLAITGTGAANIVTIAARAAERPTMGYATYPTGGLQDTTMTTKTRLRPSTTAHSLSPSMPFSTSVTDAARAATILTLYDPPTPVTPVTPSPIIVYTTEFATATATPVVEVVTVTSTPLVTAQPEPVTVYQERITETVSVTATVTATPSSSSSSSSSEAPACAAAPSSAPAPLSGSPDLNKTFTA